MEKNKDAYAQAGVDIDEGNLFVSMVKERIAEAWPGTEKQIGGFSGNIDIPEGAKVISASTDSIGTKIQLAAFLAEHPEFNTIHKLDIDWLFQVAQDLVAMVAVDLFMEGCRPEAFIDFLAFEKLIAKKHIKFFEGLVKACKLALCKIIGGETAELPGTYARPYFFEAVGFCIGFPDKNLTRIPVESGHQAWGLLSHGAGSNGLSLIRKTTGLVSKPSKQIRQLARFRKQLNGKTLAEAVMVPTPIYIKDIYRMKKDGVRISHLSHITGGGLLENPQRNLPENMKIDIQLDSWKRPAIFNLVQKKQKVSRKDMLRTFNNGIQVIVGVDDNGAEPVGQNYVHIGTFSERDSGEEQVVFYGDFDDSF